jgi:predicted lipoprotein with Yx(FWY)xxD motif
MNARLSAASLAIVISGVFCAVSAYAESLPTMASGMLVDSTGMTLYTFDKDVADSGKSQCNGPCAALWPPVIASREAKPEGKFTLIKRDDGASQWAYAGKPIYKYAEDKKAGDMSGDNFKGVWHVIK